MATSTRIAEHVIAARDIRPGDRVSRDGAAGLDHWYDTDAPGQDITVLTATPGEGVDGEDLIVITLDSAPDEPIEVLTDIRVTVIRPFPEAAPAGTRVIEALPAYLRVRYVVRDEDTVIVDRVGGRELSFDEANALAARHGFSLFDI